MTHLIYETLVQVLLEKVPGFRAFLQEQDFEDYELDYVVFGRFATFLRDRLSGSEVQPSDPTIQKGFELLNEMASSHDERIVNLAVVGVFEILTDSPKSIEVSRQLLYGKAIDHFEEIMRRWGLGTTRQEAQ